MPVHGWIFEPERDSAWRRGLIAQVQALLGVAPRTPDGRRCADRTALFLADNERGKRVRIWIAGQVIALGESGKNGHFRGVVRVPRDAAAAVRALTWRALTGDDRKFTGRAHLTPPEGLSVISDIDDTIKISHVLDKKKLMRHTFAAPFAAVPGMADAYARWAKRRATFHYVSSSPWQLYPHLAPFMAAAGFPRGAFHLKDFRLKDRSALNLTKSSLETKPPVIEDILERYPRRVFVLVGDSGEVDPEVYGKIARAHPKQVKHIYIRRVEGAANGEERFAKAFTGLDKTRWTVFEDPTALK